MERFTHPFEAIINNDSRILILGTFPSLDSFKYDFYYAHKRNQFWRILGEVFDMPYTTLEEKLQILQKHKIALWDIVASCERKNSSDANLKNIVPSDIPSLLNRYPNIEQIAFTGKKAYALYKKLYSDLLVRTVVLPSPSPAYAAMKFEEKKAIYAKLFEN